MSSRISAIGFVSTLVLAGCAGTEKAPPVAPGGNTQQAATKAEPAQKPAPAPTNVRVSKEIQEACSLADSEVYFDFDSARVRPTEDQALRKIVDCFVTGPLSGRAMVLVGHADPRGDEEYNLALGGSRSDAVARELVARNLKRSQVSTSSRGEMEATGTDEATWAKDRRVDVRLAY
jgi:peptidoglycan-associated lipoprotein